MMVLWIAAIFMAAFDKLVMSIPIATGNCPSSLW